MGFGTILLTVLLVSWVALAAFAFWKKQSAIVSLLGTLLCAVLITVCALLITDLLAPKDSPPPPTLQQEIEFQQKAREKQEYSDSIDARTWAKIYVEKTLIAPTTAKFQNTLDFTVGKKRDKRGGMVNDVWVVSGYVDAQNSFGAMLRTNWYVEMKKVGNDWLLLKIQN